MLAALSYVILGRGVLGLPNIKNLLPNIQAFKPSVLVVAARPGEGLTRPPPRRAAASRAHVRVGAKRARAYSLASEKTRLAKSLQKIRHGIAELDLERSARSSA